MKSKDLQNIVFSKYQKGDTPTESIGGISLTTIKSWCQMNRQSASIQLLGARAGPRIVRILKRIYKQLKTVYIENRS